MTAFIQIEISPRLRRCEKMPVAQTISHKRLYPCLGAWDQFAHVKCARIPALSAGSFPINAELRLAEALHHRYYSSNKLSLKEISYLLLLIA
ncbi:MAG: hypothetical protein U1F16_06575 [Turneriella sp.]